MKLKNRKGISLITLIVTIIIIIILAGIVILNITKNNPINNAKISSLLNNKDIIESQIYLYLSKISAKTQGEFTNKQIITGLEGNPNVTDLISKKGATEYKIIEGKNSTINSFPKTVSINLHNGTTVEAYKLDKELYEKNIESELPATTVNGAAWYISSEDFKIYLVFENDANMPQWMNEDENLEPNLHSVVGKATVIDTSVMTLVEMYELAEEDGCINEDGSCTNEEHLHIGDYVNYNAGNVGQYVSLGSMSGMTAYKESGESILSEEETQVFNIDPNINWRVLGLSENDNILLISGRPIKKETSIDNPYYYLAGARGLITGINELDNICEMYGNGNGAIEARSVTVNDINYFCGVKNNIITDIDSRGNYGKTDNYVSHFESAEAYLDNIKSNFSKTSDAYWYKGNNSLLKTAQNDRLFDLLFGSTYINRYWLASKTTCINSSTAGYAIRRVWSEEVCYNYILRSNGVESRAGYGVRPVVELEEDVTNKVIKRIPDQVEVDITAGMVE